MKRILIATALMFSFITSSFGQTNPAEEQTFKNLTKYMLAIHLCNYNVKQAIVDAEVLKAMSFGYSYEQVEQITAFSTIFVLDDLKNLGYTNESFCKQLLVENKDVIFLN